MDVYMTVLIAGGDSFTYGSELPSQEHTWANLLANRLGWNICNTARPGASNSSIRRNVMNAVHKYFDEDLRVFVMWSFPNRYEFKFLFDTGQIDSPWYNINPWTFNKDNFKEHYLNANDDVLIMQEQNRKNAEEKGISDFARTYIKNIAQDPYWEIYTSWLEMTMLTNYLIVNGIEFQYALVDNSLLDYNNLDSTLKTLEREITAMPFVSTIGMFNWAKQTKQPFYTTHPTEKAHCNWINMLYGDIKWT